MRTSSYERVIAGAALAVLLAAGGCTNSEVIGTSSGAISLTLQTVGGSGRYDDAVINVSQIFLKPAQVEAQAALLQNPIGLLTLPITVNLNNPDIVTVRVGAPPAGSTPLTEGTYEITRIVVGQFTLEDLPPPMYGPTCPQMIDVLALPPNTTQASRTEIVYASPPQIVITSTDTAELRIVIDAPGLISVLESQFVCLTNQSCLTNGITTPPPCLRSYSSPFGFQLAPFFTIQQL